MSDLYFEHLVSRKKTVRDKAIQIGLIVLTVIVAAAGFVIPFGFIVAIGLAVADYFILPTLNIEYEYLYVNGELDIDKIMSRTKRKKVVSLDVAQMEMMAPLKSHRMDYYNSNTRMKVYDYSSGDPSQKTYAMVIPIGQELGKVLLDLDDRMYENIYKSAPRKVFND